MLDRQASPCGPRIGNWTDPSLSLLASAMGSYHPFPPVESVVPMFAVVSPSTLSQQTSTLPTSAVLMNVGVLIHLCNKEGVRSPGAVGTKQGRDRRFNVILHRYNQGL